MALVRVLALADLPDGTSTKVTIQTHQIALFRAGDAVYAIHDTCSHGTASLAAGTFDSDELCVACPAHGALFDVQTGIPRTLPAYQPVTSYVVQIQHGDILVDIPEPHQ